MFFYLFVVFQIFYSVNCRISCYDTRYGINTFDYIVTADHFPTELDSSKLENNSINCFIQVLWYRNPRTTKITLIAENQFNALASGHKLEVDVGYENDGLITIWEKQAIYECNTDQCNSLSQLKLLLSSLTMNDSLIDLAYLLFPTIPFHASWCHRGSNATFQTCDTTIPDNLCKHCELAGIRNEKGTEICATCSAEDSSKYSIAHGKKFNMTDRTHSNSWVIACGRNNCNLPSISESILEKSHIHFDFNKFLNNQTTVLSMNKIFLFFIIFFIKLFFFFENQLIHKKFS